MTKPNKEEAIQWYAHNKGLYKKLSDKVQNIISELIEEAKIQIHIITNRAKDIESFKNKIEDAKYDDPINQITDLAGIRIIAYVEDDLKPICEIIENSFDIDEKNSTDKSEELGTDKVGYKSIHYVAKIKSDRLSLPEYKKFKDLKFEIQVRTILQHAWAEIEHDRNYKFNGVLPQEIRRRFKILAGTLELVDREFNILSKEIDKISQSVEIADQEDKLSELEMNSTTLKKFLKTRFETLLVEGMEPNFNNSDKIIMQEMKDFGIKNLDDLNSIIPDNFLQNYKTTRSKILTGNMTGLLRNIMIINNSRKYFAKAWKHHWKGVRKESIELYGKYNIDIEKLMHENGMRTVSHDQKKGNQ